MLDTLFAAGSVYHFPFPSEKLLLSWSKPSGVSGHEKEQLGQKSDVLPFLSLALLCWALGPFSTHALSPCTNPQSHPGRAHGTSSCPPHRSDRSRSLVIGKALYRLKTQTPSTGRGGVEPLFPSVKHPGLVGPCLVGVPETPSLRVTGTSWEEHSSSVSSVISPCGRAVGPAAVERAGNHIWHRKRGQHPRTAQLKLLSEGYPPLNHTTCSRIALRSGWPSPQPPSHQGPSLLDTLPPPLQSPCGAPKGQPSPAAQTVLQGPPSTRHSGSPPSLGGADLGLSLLEGRAACTQLHPVPRGESL